MKKTYLLSVIVPVYNSSKYLKECLDSILNQTYSNIEVICVNDGSTDDSLSILEQYVQVDKRVRIIDQKNTGVGQARNNALAVVNGDYVAFVDADDFVDKNIYTKTIGSVNDSDVVIFGAKTNYNKKKVIKSGQYSCRRFDEKYNIKNLFAYHSVAWNKIYKREFLKNNNICFLTTRTGEDQLFSLKALLLANNVEVCREDLYIYRKEHSGTLSRSKNREDSSPIIITYQVEKFLSDINISTAKKCKILSKYILKAITWYSKTSATYSDTYFNELNQLLSFMQCRLERYWWNYFTLDRNDSYIVLKGKYILAKLIYKINN